MKFLKILWIALAATALAGFLSWISLFLAWGRIVDIEIGITISILIGIIFL